MDASDVFIMGVVKWTKVDIDKYSQNLVMYILLFT